MSRDSGAQARDTEELFERCVIRNRKPGRARYEIKCRLGLWSVDAPNKWTAEAEAMHYWIQYYRDGEYAAHLSETPTPDKREE